MSVTTFRVKLVKKEKVSSDAWEFYFERPANFEYSAGQYIKMFLDIKDSDRRGKTRYFTLSSSPTEKNLLITTRILRSTFKKRLGDLKIGSTVKMRGPWGDFILPESNPKPLVFVAGGIGMTPYRSILKYAQDTKIFPKIHLLVSYRTKSDILFTQELKKAAVVNKKLKIITTITDDFINWKDEKGRISIALLKKHLENLSLYKYYISGPQPFVEIVQKMLLGAKIKASEIKIDDFPGYD